MKQIPNLLTALRLLVSPSLIFWMDRRWVFLAVYLFCGVTDVLDGWLARRLRVTSDLGSRLDSAADFVFFGVSIITLAFLIRDTSDGTVLILLSVVVIIRMLNLCLTRIKFHRWGILHTYGNKAAGLLLFASIPVCVVMGGFPGYVIIPLFVVSLLSALDEMTELWIRTEYDPDAKGFGYGQVLLRAGKERRRKN